MENTTSTIQNYTDTVAMEMTPDENSPIEIGKAPRKTNRVRFEMDIPPEDHGGILTEEKELPKAEERLPTKMYKTTVCLYELIKVVVSTKMKKMPPKAVGIPQ